MLGIFKERYIFIIIVIMWKITATIINNRHLHQSTRTHAPRERPVGAFQASSEEVHHAACDKMLYLLVMMTVIIVMVMMKLTKFKRLRTMMVIRTMTRSTANPSPPLAFLRLRREFPVPRLDSLLLQRNWPLHLWVDIDNKDNRNVENGDVNMVNV